MDDSRIVKVETFLSRILGIAKHFFLGKCNDVNVESEGKAKYGAVLEHFLKDGVLNTDELIQLRYIAEKYGLDESEIKMLQKSALIKYYDGIISDEKISESERASMDSLLNVLSLVKEDINFDQNSFNKYYTLGLLEQGFLPEIPRDRHDINVIFNANEILHFGASSLLQKFRKVTTRINYGGITGSIKICKGLRYRVGSMGVRTESKETLQVDDSGCFFITNQQVGFKGNKKQFAMSYSKIASFELTGEGLVIFKRGKETPYIFMLDDYEVPVSIISFILNKE